MQIVKERAYAKINLFLDVLSRREDGFHDIRSVMHTVSLYDEVTVQRTDAPKRRITITVENAPYVPADSRNLAYRAAELFLDRGEYTDAIDIHLVKSIPTAAGMAGGSSDAAAVLRAMNRMYKRPFSQKLLLQLAAELGSDVPYCLLGHTALCEGRGERMQPLPAPRDVTFVVACGDERISAKAAYEALDGLYRNFDGSVPTGGSEAYGALTAWLLGQAGLPTALFNVFEEAVLPQCPCAERIKACLLSHGAHAALLSGSGPSVFGIFSSKGAAARAVEDLLSRGIRAYAVDTVDPI